MPHCPRLPQGFDGWHLEHPLAHEAEAEGLPPPACLPLEERVLSGGRSSVVASESEIQRGRVLLSG